MLASSHLQQTASMHYSYPHDSSGTHCCCCCSNNNEDASSTRHNVRQRRRRTRRPLRSSAAVLVTAWALFAVASHGLSTSLGGADGGAGCCSQQQQYDDAPAAGHHGGAHDQGPLGWCEQQAAATAAAGFTGRGNTNNNSNTNNNNNDSSSYDYDAPTTTPRNNNNNNYLPRTSGSKSTAPSRASATPLVATRTCSGATWTPPPPDASTRHSCPWLSWTSTRPTTTVTVLTVVPPPPRDAVAPQDLAPLAYKARVAAKLYARERCRVPGRVAANLFDGYRQWRRYGSFDCTGMSYQQVWEKYANMIQQETALSDEMRMKWKRRRAATTTHHPKPDDVTEQICLKILERSCQSNSMIDQMVLGNGNEQQEEQQEATPEQSPAPAVGPGSVGEGRAVAAGAG